METKSETPTVRPVATQIASAHPVGTLSSSDHAPKREARLVHGSREASSILPIVNHKDIRPKDQKLLSDVLKWMTPLCRQNLKHLVVRYDQRADRGQSTSSTILLRGGMPRDETIAVMIHECGHIVDLGAYKGTSSAGTSEFPDGPTPTYNNDTSLIFYHISWQNPWKRKMEAAEEDFVSGYAMSDPWEDVAESIVYYALHEDIFRKRAESNEALMKKLEWVETYVFDEEFEALSSEIEDGDVVWDITKLPHSLSF